MIRDCLSDYYTPQERVSLTELHKAFVEGRIKADKAIVAYIQEHPPADGIITIPGKFLNDAFSDYNKAVEEWQTARLPVIRRYAEGKSTAELVQDAKEVLRGIRWKDLDCHPFSKRIVAKIRRVDDMADVTTLFLAPQFQALKDRYGAGADGEIDDAMGEIYEAIFKKCNRIENSLKKKENADAGEN